jgi:outer membrane receptor protein involved in Fe transport
VWDGAISYTVKDWSIQLNLRNLTNETYYSRAMFLGGLPAQSRNAKLTASYNF